MKKLQIERKEFCRDCVHAKDFHSKAHDGHFILCRCKFFKFSRFLNWDWCDNFDKKKDV